MCDRSTHIKRGFAEPMSERGVERLFEFEEAFSRILDAAEKLHQKSVRDYCSSRAHRTLRRSAMTSGCKSIQDEYCEAWDHPRFLEHISCYFANFLIIWLGMSVAIAAAEKKMKCSYSHVDQPWRLGFLILGCS